MSISIVMSTYNRPHQLNNTLISITKQEVSNLEVIVVDDGTDEMTEGVCKNHKVTYYRLIRPPSYTYREVGRPLNIGIRRANNDILILQNAECMHIDPNTISKLANAVTETNVVFAKTISLYQDGSYHMVYVGRQNPRPYFFCGAIKRARLEKLRGIDEDYPGSGYEDDDLATRLSRDGVVFEFTDIEVHHQWHERAGELNMGPAQAMYTQKCAMMDSGTLGVVRNLDREWGAL